MKVITIELDGTRAIFYALEKIGDGTLEDLTGKFKSVTIEDDTDNAQIREFQATVHSFFDNLNPDKIAILKRANKGKFAASPLSFKLEGLIQCYDKKDVEMISPQTLAAFYKKTDFELEPSHKYQTNAAKLAQYLISRQ